MVEGIEVLFLFQDKDKESSCIRQYCIEEDEEEDEEEEEGIQRLFVKGWSKEIFKFLYFIFA